MNTLAVYEAPFIYPGYRVAYFCCWSNDDIGQTKKKKKKIQFCFRRFTAVRPSPLMIFSSLQQRSTLVNSVFTQQISPSDSICLHQEEHAAAPQMCFCSAPAVTRTQVVNSCRDATFDRLEDVSRDEQFAASREQKPDSCDCGYDTAEASRNKLQTCPPGKLLVRYRADLKANVIIHARSASVKHLFKGDTLSSETSSSHSASTLTWQQIRASVCE